MLRISEVSSKKTSGSASVSFPPKSNTFVPTIFYFPQHLRRRRGWSSKGPSQCPPLGATRGFGFLWAEILKTLWGQEIWLKWSTSWVVGFLKEFTKNPTNWRGREMYTYMYMSLWLYSYIYLYTRYIFPLEKMDVSVVQRLLVGECFTVQTLADKFWINCAMILLLR